MRQIRLRVGGFTLLELMVTVAIIAILASLAAPSFTQLTLRNRLVSGGNEMIGLLQLARMEAIRTNGLVEVCASADGLACGGGDWRRAIVMSRKGGVNTLVRDASLHATFVAEGDAATIAANNRIGFGPDGFARVGAGVRSGSVRLCLPGLKPADNTLVVNVNVSRVQVTRPANGGENCI